MEKKTAITVWKDKKKEKWKNLHFVRRTKRRKSTMNKKKDVWGFLGVGVTRKRKVGVVYQN